MPITQDRLKMCIEAGLAIEDKYQQAFETLGMILEQTLDRIMPQEEFVRLVRRLVREAPEDNVRAVVLLESELRTVDKNYKRNLAVANWKRRQRGKDEKTPADSLPKPRPKITKQDLAVYLPAEETYSQPETPFDGLSPGDEFISSPSRGQPSQTWNINAEGNIQPGSASGVKTPMDPVLVEFLAKQKTRLEAESARRAAEYKAQVEAMTEEDIAKLKDQATQNKRGY